MVHKATSKGGPAQLILHRTRTCKFAPSPTSTPAPTPTPAVAIPQPLEAPFAHQTRSITGAANNDMPHQAAVRRYLKELIAALALWELPVLDEDTGKLLKFFQLCNPLKLYPTWNEFLSN